MERDDWPLEDSVEENPLEEALFAQKLLEADSVEENPLEEALFAQKLLEADSVTDNLQEEDLLTENTQDDNSFDEDPLAPTLRNQNLDTQAKLMLVNVFKYMQTFRLVQAKATGEDMNVNKTVAEATGVSMGTVKKIIREFRMEGIERAIRPPTKERLRKRKTDIVVEVDEAVGAKTVKKERKRRK